MKKPTLLCILDGFGLNPNRNGNAVALAKKPVIDELMRSCPNGTLTTFGEAVGLPEGQMGNSEVGHLNIGAGRVVEQWLLRISRALAGSFLDHSAAYQGFLKGCQTARRIHIVGLLSSGGVHSHSEHLKLLIKRLRSDLPDHTIALHLISDGRDVSPSAFEGDLAELEGFIRSVGGCVIQSISGRFFAMDRDKRWERIEAAYNAIALGRGNSIDDCAKYVTDSYAKGITDEFIEPGVTSPTGFDPSDALVFFNFREDRMREIVSALCADSFDGFKRSAQILKAEKLLCFTESDHTLKLPFLFEQLEIKNHLGEVIAASGIKQLRVAETEKYPHVTYFLNGGIEQPYAGEDRKLVASPRDVKTYDLKPEMSAPGVAELVIDGLRSKEYGLIVVNFANCDMVGHTGVVNAGIKAVETVDRCLGEVLNVLKEHGGQALIIADHGNAEQMVNYESGTPHTAHTTYPVPVILFNYNGSASIRAGGALCDVAPTILKMMGVPQPSEMTGKALI
ncbi:MAG: 2,3-bisphosphoglycerate-independent phosphoglycerate mutase [Pseudomonadota bacterium]